MKNKFSKWDVGGGSRSIVQGLNLFTSRNLFKSLKSILMVVTLLSLSSNVWGATTKTSTVTSSTATNSPVTIDGVEWVLTTESKTGSPSITNAKYSSIYGLKFGSSGSNYWGTVKFSTDYFEDKNITAVTVNILNNGSKSATMTVKQGSTTIGTATKTFGTTWTDLTANTNKGSGGTLEITYQVAQASYWHSITVTYEEGSSTTYSLVGSFGTGHDWNLDDVMSGSGTVSKTMTLAANSAYEFKIAKDKAWTTTYGNGGAIVTPISGWVFNTSANNCRLYTGPAGEYTFTFNPTNAQVSVTYPTNVSHPAAGYSYFEKNGSDTYIKPYIYTDDGHRVSDWDGSPYVGTTTTICGTTYFYFALQGCGYNNVIVRYNNEGSQTASMSATSASQKWANKDASSFSAFSTYSITFNGNGASGSMTSITNLACGANQTIPACTFATPTDKAFDGWKANVNVTINGATVTAGTKISAGATLQNITSDITLTAQWRDLPKYTVTLKDDNTELTQEHYQSSVDLPSRTTSCAGYTFEGWSTTHVEAETSTKPTIIAAGNYTPTANIELWPVFSKTTGGGTKTDVINASMTSGYLSNVESSAWYDGSYNNSFTVTGSATNNTYAIASMGLKGQPEGTALRWNGNGWLETSTNVNGDKLSSITINGTDNKVLALWAVFSPDGDWDVLDQNLGNLTISGGTVTYNFTADATHIQLKGTASSTLITSITLTYGSSSTTYIAAPECYETTITLAKGTDGKTDGTATAAKGSSTLSGYTAAVGPDHYHLLGYYDGDTKVIDASGQLVANAGSYTDGSANWQKQDAALTLTAKWEVNSHTLTWDLNDGTAGTGTITPAGSVAYGTVLQYTVEPTKDGKKFNGWSPEMISGTTTMPDNDQTYTAQWRDIVWTDYLTDCSAPDTWTVWYEDPSDSQWKDAAIADVTSGSVVFNFTEKGQQFSFKIRKTNDGVNYTYYGASYEDNEYTYAKSLDVEHKYWTLNGNAGGYDVNVTTAAKGTYTIHISMDGDNPRIYIEYPTPYTIHFDGKGADYGSMADIVNIASGENVVLPANDFNKTNNVFVGWDTNSAGTNVVYDDQATINNVSADITLYAVWVSARYTITLDANGGTVSPDKVQQAVVGGTVALPTPTKDGYAFDGWYTEREGGSKITEAYPIPLADATYYAHWTSLETSWYVKGDFDWINGVQFVKMPGQSSDVAFAIVEWNSNDNMNFKIYDSAEGKWYGNEGTMTRTNCTGWNVWNNNNNNTKLAPTGHGHYIFKLDLSGEYPAISVSYPNWNYDSHNSTAGTRGQGNFTYVNPLDWKYEGFILPTINNESDEGKQIWIGDGAWNDNYSENWWYRWIKLNQYADETVGHGVDGAVGTLHINPFSGSENYGLRFDPAGYGMKYGSGSGVSYMTGGYAFTQKTNDPAVWNTQAIENIEDLQGKQFYVGLATATEGEYKFSYDYVGECNGLSAIANINDIKVWTEANPDRWGDATVGSLSNTRGHFQIWADNASQKNFYIHWIPDNKMTFDLGDAEKHIAAIDPMYRGRDLSGSEATITLPEPADWISHTFGGWVINGVHHNAGEEILLNEDMTAEAQWTTNYYTITYTGISAYSTTCDGSTLVLCGTDQTVCTPIEATGYEFSGWTSDVEIGGETEFEGGEPFTMPCEDVTFTGSYTPIVYNITYEGVEGASNPNPTSYTIETPTITLQDLGARTGYNFSHWTCNDATITTIPQGSTGDMPIVAHWNAKQTNITLNHEGSATGSDNVVATYDAAMPAITIPSRAGYSFNGYFDAAKNGTQYYDDAGASVRNWDKEEATADLYAQWTALEVHYTVKHYKQQLDGTYLSTPDRTEDLTALAGATRTPDRSTWVGFTAPAGQQVTIAGDGSTVVNYQYTRNKYTLIWNFDGGTPDGDYTEGGDVYYEAPITYPTTVNRDGFCFMGWTYSTGTKQPSTMPHEELTITAQWAAYTNYRTYCGNAVTFYAQNGTEPEEEYVITTDNNKITTPTLVETGFTQPEGWVLIGWTKVGGDPKVIVEPSVANVAVEDGDEYNAVWTHITITGNVLTTSAVGVQVGTRIHVEGTTNKAYGLRVSFVDTKGTDDPSDDVTYGSATGQTAVTQSDFRLASTSYTYIDDNIIRIESTAAGDTHSSDYNVVYTPKTANEIDNYVLKIQVMQTSQTALDGALYTLNLKGRALPDNFVIAVKNNSEQWLALPANITAASTPAGMPITVTGEGLGMTTDVSLAAAYSLTGKTFVKDSVFFTSAYNGGNLWAAKSTSDINDNTADVTAANRKNYEWGLTPTDETLISYNMANKNNGKELKYYEDSKFGMYADGVNTIYFIAVTPKEETTAVVDEWYQNKMLFHLPFAMKSVSMTINGVAVEDDDITIVNRKIKTTGYVLYELGGDIDLVAHSGQVMELTIGDGTTEYVANISIPQIIVSEVDGCSALPAKADVVVRDGGHLTIDVEGALAKSFNNVTIYPNSKISVPEGKYFNVKSLTFFGGIDEMNGEETNIYAPELSLKGTMKADTLIYRMRVNAEHMMPVSFPYNVTINKIVREDKLDSPSWGKVGVDIKLETYDGAARAAGNRRKSDESTWTEIKEGTLTAGIGYTVAAQNRFRNYLYTILDFPMANPYKSVAAEEVAKNAAVQAHDAVNWYDKGWNLMGNPYLAGITGAGAIKVNEKDYDFVYIPTADGEDYYQGPIATAKILPFKDFFVQVNEGGTMYFDLTKRVDAPARMLADIERTAQFSIGLAGANKTDITYFKVADNFTESYDIPGDNAKMFGSAVNTKVYSLLNGEDQLAQMALNADMTAQPIQLGYIAPENGEYIFALDNTYTDYQNVEHIYLLENGEIKVDLLNAQYTFTTEAKTEDERFAILIVMKGAKMPTNLIDGLFNNDVASPKKVIYNDHFYILNTNRRVYDGTGKYINKMQENR